MLNSYTSQFEREEELMYFLAISYKKMEEYSDAFAVSKALERINPNYIKNLLNLSDLYRLMKDFTNAKMYSEKVLEKDPKNEVALKIISLV